MPSRTYELAPVEVVPELFLTAAGSLGRRASQAIHIATGCNPCGSGNGAAAGTLATSVAFNLTGVDVTEDMGPFEIAPGTQYDDGLVMGADPA